MEFIPLVQMAVLVFALINFFKAISNDDKNAWLTQMIVWVAGILVVLLAAQTDFAGGIVIGDMALSDLNFWSLLFIGMTVSSLASFGVELKKALDRNDSAVNPPMFKFDKDPS